MPREARANFGQDAAERLAISALSFLAGRPDDLGRFLTLSGMGPGDLRQSASEPGFLAGVLAYLGSDEPLLVAFAAEEGVPATRVSEAIRLMNGEAM